MESAKFTTWTFVLLFFLNLILVIHLLFGFITPMVMALVLASLFSPINLALEKRMPNKPYWAAFLCTLLVFLLVLIPLIFFLVTLTKQALNIYEISNRFSNGEEFAEWIATIKSTLEYWQDFLAGFGYKFAPEKALEWVITAVNSFGKRMYDTLSVMLINLASVAINFVLTILFVFVFFMNASSIRKFFFELIPLPAHDKDRLANRFSELAFAIFVGNGLISILEGIIGGFLFWCFNVDGAVIWGFSIAVTAFLPLVGSSVVVVPASVFIYLQGHPISAIFFLILNTIQLTTLEILVKPRLIGQKTHMHAVLVFLSIIAGVQVYGVFGLFYGPLLVTMFLSLAQMYNEHYRDKLLQDNK